MNPSREDLIRRIADTEARLTLLDRQRRKAREEVQALRDKLTVDAYGDSEQRSGFRCMLEEKLGLPFEARVLGVAVIVEGVDLTPAEEIVAICRRGRERQAIPILDRPLPSLATKCGMDRSLPTLGKPPLMTSSHGRALDTSVDT